MSAEDRQALREHLVSYFESDPLAGVTPESHADTVMNVVDRIVERANGGPSQ